MELILEKEMFQSDLTEWIHILKKLNLDENLTSINIDVEITDTY